MVNMLSLEKVDEWYIRGSRVLYSKYSKYSSSNTSVWW